MLALVIGDSALPQTFNLVALLFKDEGGLAKHPLSCHPQRVFGRRENARKGEKVKENRQAGKLKAFAPIFIYRLKKLLLHELD